MMNKNEKQSYQPPQCELLSVACEGMVALSPGYTEWPDVDFTD